MFSSSTARGNIVNQENTKYVFVSVILIHDINFGALSSGGEKLLFFLFDVMRVLVHNGYSACVNGANPHTTYT